MEVGRFYCAFQYEIAFFIRKNPMGKYLIAWLLGVPAIVLVIVYFFFN